MEPVFRGVHFRMRMVVPSVAISRVLPLRMPVSLRISAGMMMRPWVSMFRITAILIKTVLSFRRNRKRSGASASFPAWLYRVFLCCVWVRLPLHLLALGLLICEHLFPV